jgi:RHS repeat-associated protein
MATFSGSDNHLDGYFYDAAGNILHIPSSNANPDPHDLIYDAEGHITAIDGGSSASYVYDAEGRRVRVNLPGQSSWDNVECLFDLQGRCITRTNYSNQAWSSGDVYAAGEHIATYNSGTTFFSHSDWLGTERYRTDPQTVPQEFCSSLPFGDSLSCVNDRGISTKHFTGKERDSETGLDYFGARYYGSNMGRMLSPDPENFGARRPDPQSWNAYAYARNNPLTYTDPDGLSYRVCDNDGKNCYNFENDDDYKQWLKDSHLQEAGGSLYARNDDGSRTKLGTSEYYDGDAYNALALAGAMAKPGVDIATHGLMMFGYIIAPPVLFGAECLAGSSGCTASNGVMSALALPPELKILSEGAALARAGRGLAAAEILEKAGGFAQATKDFEAIQGAERTIGNVKVKELADGTKVVLRSFSKDGRATVEVQHASGAVTKVRY